MHPKCKVGPPRAAAPDHVAHHPTSRGGALPLPLPTAGESVNSLPSGVYLAPWTLGGARVYVAVDHRGELVDWRPVAHGLRAEATIDDLWRALGRHHGPRLVIG